MSGVRIRLGLIRTKKDKEKLRAEVEELKKKVDKKMDKK